MSEGSEAPEKEVSAARAPAPASSRWRGRLVLAAKLALAGGLLAWLVVSDRLQLDRLASIPFSLELVVYLGIALVSMTLPGVRWWLLLRIQDVDVPLRQALSLTWVGYFATVFLPGGASGDLAKGYLIVRDREQGRIRTLSTVLADRLMGLGSFLLMGCLSGLYLVLSGQGTEPVLALAGTAGLLLAGLTLGGAALLFEPTRRQLLRVCPAGLRLTLQHSLESYGRRKGGLLACFGLSLLTGVLVLVLFALGAALLGEPIAWSAPFLVGPLVVVVNCLPLTPGGLGVGEAVSHSLFRVLGVTCGAEVMALWRVSLTVLSLPGLLFLLQPKGSSNAKVEGTPQRSEQYVCD